jgi:hypothetical protein
MSLLLIRFMLRMKKTGVTTTIQMRLMGSEDSRFPNINPLVRLTTCVRGRITFANTCMNAGRLANGKKVPLRRNIGVMNRKPG